MLECERLAEKEFSTEADSRYCASTPRNKGNWFLTCKGPSNAYPVTARNEVDKREIIRVNSFPMAGNKLPEAAPEVNSGELIPVTAKCKMMYNVEVFLVFIIQCKALGEYVHEKL
jgi:hypothetical protein